MELGSGAKYDFPRDVIIEPFVKEILKVSKYVAKLEAGLADNLKYNLCKPSETIEGHLRWLLTDFLDDSVADFECAWDRAFPDFDELAKSGTLVGDSGDKRFYEGGGWSLNAAEDNQ